MPANTESTPNAYSRHETIACKSQLKIAVDLMPILPGRANSGVKPAILAFLHGKIWLKL